MYSFYCGLDVVLIWKSLLGRPAALSDLRRNLRE